MNDILGFPKVKFCRHIFFFCLESETMDSENDEEWDIKETAVDLNSNRMAESFSDFQKVWNNEINLSKIMLYF